MTTEQIYQLIYQVAIIVVTLLAGGASVEIIRLLKKQLKTNGAWTLALVWVVAILITIATMIVEYALVPGSVTVENFGTVAVTVVLASQMRYRMLVDEMADSEPESGEPEPTA